ncbi:MAG: histidine kinase [Sphingomonas bacterium]|nr:histidine kinase [Sphingomonas bacterium]
MTEPHCRAKAYGIESGALETVPTDFEADIAAIERIEAVPTILDVVCRTTGMGFAAVARVTSDRWIACGVRDDIAFGLAPGGELKIATTICSEIRESGEPVIINNVAEDAIYHAHHTPQLYGFQCYISMPIILRNGEFFGTLCAIDPRPAMLDTPETIGMFRMFADLIAFHLHANEQLARSEANLLDERNTAELREQFIAVLGHDLRNPLSSIGAGVHLLTKAPPPEKASRILALMQGSVDRMAVLIDNVLDLARGRLGGGLSILRQSVDLAPMLKHVVNELRVGHPGRTILSDIAIDVPVDCDPSRIGQLFSNLLGNALTHGAAAEPVRVDATTADGMLTLSVSNGGDPIPPDAIERLFQPFARGTVRHDAAGLGLGLYIAAEIAAAHGGTLGVTSTTDATCFTLRMPLR